MSEIRTSENIGEIAKALAAAQAEMENVAKDRKNDHFKSSYATLSSVLDEVRPKLAKQGISILQAPVNEGENIGVVTRLAHSSGEWIESALYVRPTKFDAQGAGSAITYCRRYTLMALAGVGPDDDDGEAAVGSPAPRVQTNGATRSAAPVPPPERPAHLTRNGNGNGHAMPPHPEESGDVTAARQRVKMLVSKIARCIDTAPNDHACDMVMEDARDELKEIEAVQEKVFKLQGEDVTGPQMANALRARYNAKIASLRSGK